MVGGIPREGIPTIGGNGMVGVQGGKRGKDIGNVLIWDGSKGVLVFTRVYETVGGRWGSPVYPVSGDIREKRPPASRFRSCSAVGLSASCGDLVRLFQSGGLRPCLLS